MKNKSSRKKQIFKDCLKSFASPFYIYLIYTLFLFLIFWLYGLMLEPFVYLAIFVFAFLLNKKIVLTVCRTVLKKAVRRGTEEKKNDSDL